MYSFGYEASARLLGMKRVGRGVGLALSVGAFMVAALWTASPSLAGPSEAATPVGHQAIMTTLVQPCAGVDVVRSVTFRVSSYVGASEISATVDGSVDAVTPVGPMADAVLEYRVLPEDGPLRILVADSGGEVHDPSPLADVTVSGCAHQTDHGGSPSGLALETYQECVDGQPQVRATAVNTGSSPLSLTVRSTEASDVSPGLIVLPGARVKMNQVPGQATYSVLTDGTLVGSSSLQDVADCGTEGQGKSLPSGESDSSAPEARESPYLSAAPSSSAVGQEQATQGPQDGQAAASSLSVGAPPVAPLGGAELADTGVVAKAPLLLGSACLLSGVLAVSGSAIWKRKTSAGRD